MPDRGLPEPDRGRADGVHGLCHPVRVGARASGTPRGGAAALGREGPEGVRRLPRELRALRRVARAPSGPRLTARAARGAPPYSTLASTASRRLSIGMLG